MINKIHSRLKRAYRCLVSKMRTRIPMYVPVFRSNLLEGRKALITGGTSGIGYAIAKAFLEAGATVCITGRNEDRLEAALISFKKDLSVNAAVQDRIFGVVMDNLNVASFSKNVMNARRLMNGLDILVNNAGVVGGDGSEDSYDLVTETNTKAPYFLSNLIS